MAFTFTSLFGGEQVTPAFPSYLSISLTEDIVLAWPAEQSPSGVSVLADIVEVTAATGGLTISMSSALQGSTGYSALFNNVGANAFTVLDAAGNVLMTVASGQVWQIYLADNSTLQGTWRTFQFGAGVSNANAAALAGAGLKAITTTLNETIVVNVQAANYVSTAADLATCIEWIGGTGTITLPSAASAGANWFVILKNAGSGNVTVAPPTGTIDQVASLVFAPDDSAFVVCDGANYFTIGFGQAINSVFDFISINVAGGSNVTLAGAQQNRVSYRFTGALTGNIEIIVPNTIQQYWVDNETTGAFSLTVTTSGGSGIVVAQGTRTILYCDGTNVYNAVSFGSTGFVSGSAASPSIFFTADPGTGLYDAGSGILGFSVGGAARGSIGGDGAWHIAGITAQVYALTVEGNGVGPSKTVLFSTPFSSVAASPLLTLFSEAVNGWATLSLCGNNGSPGTTDFSIWQNGNDLSGNLAVRAAGANMNFFTNGAEHMQLDAGGSLHLLGGVNPITLLQTTSASATTGTAGAPPAQVSGYWQIQISGITYNIPVYNP